MYQKTSQYLVWPPFAERHLHRIELIRLLIVACGMLFHSSSMAVQSWILAGAGTRCHTCQSRVSQTCSNSDVCWACKSWKNWDIFSFQELCTDPCDMGPCIIMQKREVMAVDEWHDNGPQDLVTVSLCIQIAIDKMQLCSLSIAYALCHTITQPPWGTVHSANLSPTQSRTRGLRLWGSLDVLLNSLKQHWRRLVVEILTFNSLATALVDSCSQHLKHLWHCCVTKLHILVAYCPQHKVHLCNDHAV